METRLHSWETYLYKYFLPIAWIPWDGFRSLRTAVPASDPNFVAIRSVAVVLWCVTYALLVFYAVRLKTVFMNENGLRIRGYFTEIEIPFSEVASVRHNAIFKNDNLFLNAGSAFGDRILFITRRRVRTENGAISTLEMLRQLIH